MNTKEDIIFDVSISVPDEKVTFVNISYEKIQEAMKEAFDHTGAKEEIDAEKFLHEFANRLNTKGNTITWRGKTMNMFFYLK